MEGVWKFLAAIQEEASIPLAIVQWNALPEAVVSLQDLDSFKVAVSKLQHSRP